MLLRIYWFLYFHSFFHSRFISVTYLVNFKLGSGATKCFIAALALLQEFFSLTKKHTQKFWLPLFSLASLFSLSLSPHTHTNIHSRARLLFPQQFSYRNQISTVLICVFEWKREKERELCSEYFSMSFAYENVFEGTN